MTEPRGRAARWNTALVLVPSTAAMLGGAVAWASNTTPDYGSAPATNQQQTTPPPANPATDPQAVAYRHKIEKQLKLYRKNSARLRHQLHALRKQTAQLRIAAPPAAAPVYGGSGGYSGGGTSGGSSGGGGVVVAPPPVVQAPPPAPAPPPPPVNGGTGASGAP